MPRGDRTGPSGMGPMTGRRMGHCAGYPSPGFTNSGFGFRHGFGRRFTQWGQPAYIEPTKEQEIEMLKQEKKTIESEEKIIKEEIAEIKKRIDELSKK